MVSMNSAYRLMAIIPNMFRLAVVSALLMISLNAKAITVVNTFTNGPDTDILCRNNSHPSLVQNCWTAGTSSGHNFVIANSGNDALLADTAFGSVLGDSVLMYKAESAADNSPGTLPAAEEGKLRDSYDTRFIFDLLDAGDGYTGATIRHTGGPAIDCSHDCFLVIKDGAHNPAAYLFNLALGWDPLGANGGQPTTEGPSSWDGIMDLRLSNFWNDKGGSISYLALYGKDISAVPVPGAVWLFGTALLGFIGLSRSTRV